VNIRLQNSSVICNAAEGETVLLACARSGIILSAPCGGRLRCDKCKVQLIEGRVSGDVPDDEGWVRSCVAVPVSDIIIACPQAGDFIDNEVTASPGERKCPPVVDASAVGATGVAIDIGTTTVSARLVDLNTGLVLGTVSELNDQRVFGADLMSRIGAAQKGKTKELFTLLNRQTERILNLFQKQWNIQDIEKLVVSGNTVMLHLFLNIDPSSMGKMPFTPVFLEGRELKGEELSLSVIHVSVLPSVSSFIGADITADLAVLDILNIPGPSLLVDIGTNGEMALAHRGTIFCCSTAAGPAFEGAEISCGMGGVSGAVSAVEITDNGISVTTIGNTPPLGVCGSGLVDAVALMLKQGIIDETGFMAETEKGFALAPGVSITGRDIRQFQLAKSAILSGIKILCKNGGLQPTDIRNTFIAGGFGFFINKKNAIATGIFPQEFTDSLSICGNLSLQGAEDCLSDANFLERCKRIIGQCTIVDLAADPSFTDEFTNNMLFPYLTPRHRGTKDDALFAN
jgi:uncharacterized 2Fe-2S/4Fe-4S cluster protein (DUF4445 family)